MLTVDARELCYFKLVDMPYGFFRDINMGSGQFYLFLSLLISVPTDDF